MTHTEPLNSGLYTAPEYGERTLGVPFRMGVKDAAQMLKAARSS